MFLARQFWSDLLEGRILPEQEVFRYGGMENGEECERGEQCLFHGPGSFFSGWISHFQ